MINSTVKDSFTVAKGWRKRGAGRIKLMNTTQTQVRSIDEALSVKQPCCVEDTMKLALEALKNLINQHYAETTTSDDLEKADNAITAIKEALAQPAAAEQHKQEPVAFELYHHIVLKLAEAGCKLSEQQKMVLCNLKAVTHPPQPKKPDLGGIGVFHPQEPEQEPVGALLLGGIFQTSEGFEFEEWDVEWNNKAVEALQEKLVTSDPVTLNLYTTPPQRPSRSDIKPLTDEEIYQMWTDEGLANSYEIYSLKEHVRRAARAIEAAHGIKE